MISANEQAFAAAIDAADFDLAAAVIQIAVVENDQADPTLCEQQLLLLVQLAELELPPFSAANTSECAQALCEFFSSQGFRGNRADYYAPSNSHIDAVLRTRLGIPISLAFLYLHVARDALGWPLSAVGFPGHFLLRLDADDPGVSASRVNDNTRFIDPFAAETLDVAACEERFKQGQGKQFPWEITYLDSIDDASMLWRMLANLKQIYAKARQYDAMLRVLGLQLLLRPGDIVGRLERATVLGKLDCFAACADDLEQVIAQIRSGRHEAPIDQAQTIPNIAELEKKLRSLRKRDMTLH